MITQTELEHRLSLVNARFAGDQLELFSRYNGKIGICFVKADSKGWRGVLFRGSRQACYDYLQGILDGAALAERTI